MEKLRPQKYARAPAPHGGEEVVMLESPNQQKSIQDKLENVAVIVEKASSPKEAFAIFKDFIEKLRAKYPNQRYPDQETLERINPERKTVNYSGPLVTYVARVDTEVQGIVTG